jgi:hypothetical protein
VLKAVRRHIQSPTSKQLSTKNSKATKANFEYEEEIKTFPDKQKQKEFITSRSD